MREHDTSCRRTRTIRCTPTERVFLHKYSKCARDGSIFLKKITYVCMHILHENTEYFVNEALKGSYSVSWGNLKQNKRSITETDRKLEKKNKNR